MKNILALICFLTFFLAAFAQNNNDSIKSTLANNKNSLQRFTATIKYLETIDSYASSNVDSAIAIDLLQIAQQYKNDSLLAISYDWIGYYFSLFKGDNTTALEYYFKALPLAEKFNDKRRISSLYFDISTVYFSLKNIDEFLNFTRLGGENLPDTSSPKYDYMLVQFQRNMGNAFFEKDRLDSALFYAQLSVQTAARLKLPLYKLQTLSLEAIIYAKMNEIELANIYFNKAQSIADSMSLRKDVFFKRHIPFLILNNRMEEAKLETEKFWEFTENTQNLNFKLLAAGIKKQMFDKLNQIDSAYYYSKIESTTRDLIFNQNSQNTIQALAFKEQLRLIEETAKKAEAEHQRKQDIQFVLIALGIITFVLLFFLLSRSIVVTEKWISFFGILGLLIVFEFINLLIHPFLENVTNHSPLLMLAALVALASLLIPLHHRIEKWIKEKMTAKNRNIRLDSAKRTIEKLEGNARNIS